MIKRYYDFINEGLIFGQLPNIDWLNILCEDLDDDLNIVILEDRLCDDVGGLVNATDVRYITNNQVFACTEIHIQNNNGLQFKKLYNTRLLINKIQKKIELESYKVIQNDAADTFFSKKGGYIRLVIYPINTIK